MVKVFELDLSGPEKLDAHHCDLGGWKDVIDDVGPSYVRRMAELDRNRAAAAAEGDRSARSLSLQTDTPPAIKVQLNTGGGSFPWHYDNPGPPNRRALTCVVYLNPRWNDGDGGEIVLRPFLSRDVVVPPLHRRAVFFRSDRIAHRVLPSRTRRVCFTMWCNGTDVNSRDDVALSREHLQFASYDEARIFFANSPLQRVISRAVYGEEYLESLLECLVVGKNDPLTGEVGDDNTDAKGLTQEKRDIIVKQHEMSVLGITKKLRPLIEEFRRRKSEILQSSIVI